MHEIILGIEGSPIDPEIQGAERHLEAGREPGLISLTARKEVSLGHVTLILADVHVIELGSICCSSLPTSGMKAQLLAT